MASILPMLVAMTVILACWLVIAIAFAGIGMGARTCLNAKSTSLFRIDLDIWFGFCIVIAWLQLWHFFFPLNGYCVASIVGLSVLGWIADKGHACSKARQAIRGNLPLTICIFMSTVWLANRATGPSDAIDSGLYHWNVIRWSTDYPIVPGLGNLHIRLGANQSSLLYSAILDQGVWRGQSNHLANGFLLSMLFAQAWRGIVRLRDSSTQCAAFDALLLTPAVLMANHWWVSSHSTDVAPAILAFSAVSVWLECKDSIREPGDADWARLLIALFLTTAVCLKITVTVFALPLAIVAVWKIDNSKLRIAAVAIVAALAIPWLARGALLTGYPLYPSSILAAPVDWRVPADILAAENEHIRAFAKVHNDAFDPSKAHLWTTWEWLPLWLNLLEREIVIPLVATVFIMAWTAICRRMAFVDWHIALAAAIAVAFWFLTAPDTRFGFFLFWIMLGAFAPALVMSTKTTNAAFSGQMAAMTCVLLALANVKKPYTDPSPFGLHPSAQAEMIEFRTQRRARILVPRSGRLCFDAPLPCTPYPDPGLEQRDPHRLASGYRIVR